MDAMVGAGYRSLPASSFWAGLGGACPELVEGPGMKELGL